MRTNKWSGSSITYDATREKWLLGGKSVETWCNQENESVPMAPASSDRQKPFNYESMHFCADQAGSGIQLSSSGLTASMTVNSTHVAAANIGFSSGVHFWEIICPISCANIGIGIVRKGWEKQKANDFCEFATFKTTTPRVVGVQLNLETFHLNFWLNGRYQEAKGKRIVPEKWFPAIRLTNVGTSVILNPYASMPHVNAPTNMLENLKANIASSNLELRQRLSTWALLCGTDDTEIKPEKTVMSTLGIQEYKKAIIPSQGEQLRGFVFV
jgi:hypothetical protein